MSDIAAQSAYFGSLAHADDMKEIAQVLASIHRAVTRQSVEPRFLALTANGQTDPAGYLTLTLPGVPQGFRDRVLHVVLGGLTPFSVVAGQAASFITPSVTWSDANFPLSIMKDRAVSLPLVAYYDKWQMVVGPGYMFGVQVYDSTMSQGQYTLHVGLLREPIGERL